MKNIATQVEVCFLDPEVLKIEKTVIFGHFSSKESLPNETKTNLFISCDSEKNITAINVSDEIKEPEKVEHRFNDISGMEFDNETSLNILLTQESLQCYDAGVKGIVSEIIVIEVDALLPNEHSYLFFGYVDKNNPCVQKNHSQVWYTENKKVKNGGVALHKTGNHIATIFENYSFGFGRKMKTFGQSSKKYTDGIRHYMKLVDSENPEEQKMVKRVFNDSLYISYLSKMNEILEEKVLPYSPFWLTKEVSQQYKEIVREAIQAIEESL